MVFDNALHNIETETGAFADFLGRKKWLKYFIPYILRNTRSIVNHFGQYKLPSVSDRLSG